MTESTQMSDPYRSPEYPMDREDRPRRGGVRRPGGLTAICVISVVAGVVGILLVLMGILGFVVSLAMQGLYRHTHPSFYVLAVVVAALSWVMI